MMFTTIPRGQILKVCDRNSKDLETFHGSQSRFKIFFVLSATSMNKNRRHAGKKTTTECSIDVLCSISRLE
jgi:hypothetical protein